MSAFTIRSGDAVKIIITVKENGQPVNIGDSYCTAWAIVLRDTGGHAASYTAALTTDGTDGKMQIQRGNGDLALVGTWSVQGKVAWKTTGYITHTAPETFTVEASYA